jgi:peptide deformylase
MQERKVDLGKKMIKNTPLIKPMSIITDKEELRKGNEDIDVYEAKSIINKLEAALEYSPRTGIGLAAPQIRIHKRVAIIRIKNESINLVNPIIVDEESGFMFPDEGCLSLPGVNINTRRFNEIFVRDDLHPAGFVAVGLVAVAIQHEIDHLNGILITDRAVGKNKIGRNDPCFCGKKINGKPIKYKRCHGR